MRSSFKSALMCSALLAFSGLALAQHTDAKKPVTPPAAPAKPTTPAKPEAPKADKPAAPAGDMGGMEGMMPGEMHKKLEPMVGEFDAVVKFWMPGVPTPESAKGASSCKWILDGRFIEETFSGNMMGMPFKGIGHTGYSNISKQFESTWMDSMSTGLMVSTGKPSADGKTIDWNGQMDDPQAGKKVPVRMVTKVTDANTHVMEMFAAGPDGKEMKMMEITYTRTGGAKPETKPAAPAGNTAPTPPTGGKK